MRRKRSADGLADCCEHCHSAAMHGVLRAHLFGAGALTLLLQAQ